MRPKTPLLDEVVGVFAAAGIDGFLDNGGQWARTRIFASNLVPIGGIALL